MIVLSGGTGTPSYCRVLRKFIPDEKITVIVNTAEDIIISGNLVSPDVDTVLYLFQDSLMMQSGGVSGTTHSIRTMPLKKMGINEKLMIGDTDRATHVYRSELMSKGASLTEATLQLSTTLRIRARFFPCAMIGLKR